MLESMGEAGGGMIGIPGQTHSSVFEDQSWERRLTADRRARRDLMVVLPTCEASSDATADAGVAKPSNRLNGQ
jgi:hypothetical protein